MALKVGELFASFDLDSSGMNATVRTIESSMEALGANMVSMGSKLQSSITAPIESFAKQAISAGMDFTSQMSTVEAISGATAAEMEKLNAEALKMGSTTQFTATQAGEALEYMAMAGWKTDQMLSGLAPIMNLAAASGEDLGTTADIVTDALTAFGLKAKDAEHFSDILAVASSNANTNVSMMGETFKYIAPVAGAFGYKAEDVAVAIGLMANSGIKAGQAGTSLRAALSQMAKPSDEAESAMKKLGISLTKSNGEMKPFSELVQNLRKSFSGLSEAQQVQYAATIFGQEAMSGMLAIINASDEDIKKLTQSVSECDGATQRMADTVLNNAKGDWTLFQSAVEGAQVALFTLNENAIRSVIQGMTSLVDRFNGASDASKQAALKLALVAAAMGPVMVFGGQMLLTLSRIGVVLGTLVSPIGLAATGLALFALAATDANNEIGNMFINMSRNAKRYLGKLDTSVRSAIKTVSGRMPLLIRSMKLGISMALPQLVSTAAGIVSSLAEMIGENADGLLSIGTTIIRSIAEGIGKSIPSIAQAAVSIVTGIVKALRSGELFDAAVSSAKSIIDGFKAVDWSALGSELFSSVEDIVSGTAEMVRTAWTNAKDAMTQIKWSDVADSIRQKITFASDWLKNLILGDAASDEPTWKMVGERISGWIKGSVSFATGWLNGLILGDTMTDESTWKDVGKNVWGWIQGGFSAASDWLKGLILGDTLTAESAWREAGSKVWSWIQSGFSNAESWLKNLILGEDSEGNGWSDVGDRIVRKISESLSAITPEKITETIGDLSSIASAIIDRIVSSKADFAAAAGNLIAKLITSLSSFTGWDALASDFSSVASQVVSSLTDAIGKVAGAGANIAGAIGGILGSITLEDVVTATEAVSGLIVDGIASGFTAVVGGAASIAWAIGSVLTSINDSDLGESIGTLAADLFGKICTGICEVTETPDMSRFMQNIGKGIEEAVTFLGDIAGAIARYITSEEGIKTMLSAGKGIAGALIQGIGEGLIGLSRGIFNVFTSVLSGVIESVLGWFGIEKDVMVEAMNSMTFENIDGEQITGRMLNKIVGGGDSSATIVTQAQAYVALVEAGFEAQANEADFTPAGVALSKAISDGFFAGNPDAEARAMAALFATGMADGFYEQDFGLYEAGANLFAQLYDGVEQSSDILIPLLQEFGISVPATIAEALGSEGAWEPSVNAVSSGMQAALDAAAAMSQEGGTMIAEATTQGITTGYENATDSVQTAVDTMTDIVTGASDLTNIASDAQTTGQTAGQAIGTGVSDEETSAQTAVDGLVTLMNSAYQPLVTGFGETTRLAMIGVQNGVNSISPSIANSVRTAMNTSVSTAKSIMSASAGFSIGRDMMQGLVNGIRSMSGTLASAARSAVSSAISAMRKAADAHSPSRKTLALGQDMDEGGAIGLSGGLMVKAAKKSIEDTVKAFTKGAYVTDLSAGTVATSRQAARQNAEAASAARSESDEAAYAFAVGTAIAERLIDSGVLNRKIVMNEREVGEEVADPVSQKIDQKSKSTVLGRSAQGVIG